MTSNQDQLGSGSETRHSSLATGHCRHDEPLEVFEGNASYYYHADGLGSVTELTKSRGSVANTYFYGSFGDDSPASSETVANPFHFTARERDSETKLYYYHARYYDPLFGRFLSEDPIRSKAGNEFYLHVKNRPTVSRDALGLVAFLSGACYTSICKLN